MLKASHDETSTDDTCCGRSSEQVAFSLAFLAWNIPTRGVFANLDVTLALYQFRSSPSHSYGSTKNNAFISKQP
jgi:hypothetical protein